MMPKAWSSIEEVPYCFSRSSVKFQGHIALKIVEFDPNWAFQDCNSSLNSPMAMKCCTKLETAKKRCPIVFQGYPSNFKVTRDKTSLILTQIGRFRTIGQSQLSNPSDLPCCTFADKSLGRNGIELEMQMFPDDLPLANIDAYGYCCHFMRSYVRPTIHGLGFVYCIQSAWKKWPTIWHADVSRWLTLSIHGCLWILLLVCLSVHLSVCSFTVFSGGCAFADKSLGTNGIEFDMLMYLLV